MHNLPQRIIVAAVKSSFHTISIQCPVSDTQASPTNKQRLLKLMGLNGLASSLLPSLLHFLHFLSHKFQCQFR
jgi:hypothetical protein